MNNTFFITIADSKEEEYCYAEIDLINTETKELIYNLATLYYRDGKFRLIFGNIHNEETDYLEFVKILEKAKERLLGFLPEDIHNKYVNK